MMLAKLREKIRIAWSGFLLRLAGVPMRPVLPDAEGEHLPSDVIADVRTVVPDTESQDPGHYRFPSEAMFLRLTNETAIDRDLIFRVADVVGDTIYPIDGSTPPRRLFVRRRHSNTDFRDNGLSVVLYHRLEGQLYPIGVFQLIRDPAR